VSSLPISEARPAQQPSPRSRPAHLSEVCHRYSSPACIHLRCSVSPNSEAPAESRAAAFGLVVGGLPTAYSKQTWRPCLWILASLAFAIAIVAFFVIPTDVVQTTDRRVDWVGAALVTVGLVFVQFGISDGETAPQGWKTSCERKFLPLV
jgi:hypothetical protein